MEATPVWRNGMNKRRIDTWTTIVPLGVILILCVFFVVAPSRSTEALGRLRSFLDDELGVYYLATGLLVFALSLWTAFSNIGRITLGGPGEKPRYGFFQWGAMVFTCGLAADILFYSLCEWIYYAGEKYIAELGGVQDWAPAYSLFHWGLIPWSFYAILAACFGFMLHVRGVRKQKYSEACRPILGGQTDKALGKLVDVLAVFALIAGTATTFSVATPLLSAVLTRLLGVTESKYLTIGILAFICIVYVTAVMRGIRGVSGLAGACMALFGALLIFVLLFGGQTGYIFETGLASFGKMAQNFLEMATYTDPMRETGFARNWTVFYWAYWMVWCVASPFFMGSISRGRTVRQVILGAYGFGMSSTLVSFVVLGNYGLGLQMTGRFDAISQFLLSGDIYQTILSILEYLPCHQFVLLLLAVAMVAFYATSFDSITLVASAYSYRELGEGEEAGRRMKLFWAVLLILLPMALLFSESSMQGLQTMSIIAAFPIGFVILLIIASFIKDAKRYIQEVKESHK